MKTFFISILLSLIFSVTSGQIVQSKYSGLEIKEGENWIKQESGSPPVNMDTVLFDQVIISNVHYPREAVRMGIEGDVICGIELNEQGEVVDYQVAKDIDAGTKLETLRSFDALPAKWTPAIVNGQAVKSRIWILFRFNLDEIQTYSTNTTYYRTYITMVPEIGKSKTIRANPISSKKKKKQK